MLLAASTYLPSVIMVLFSVWWTVNQNRKERLRKEAEDKRERCQELRDMKLDSIIDTIVEYMQNGAKDYYLSKFMARKGDKEYEHS